MNQLSWTASLWGSSAMCSHRASTNMSCMLTPTVLFHISTHGQYRKRDITFSMMNMIAVFQVICPTLEMSHIATGHLKCRLHCEHGSAMIKIVVWVMQHTRFINRTVSSSFARTRGNITSRKCNLTSGHDLNRLFYTDCPTAVKHLPLRVIMQLDLTLLFRETCAGWRDDSSQIKI